MRSVGWNVFLVFSGGFGALIAACSSEPGATVGSGTAGAPGLSGSAGQAVATAGAATAGSSVGGVGGQLASSGSGGGAGAPITDAGSGGVGGVALVTFQRPEGQLPNVARDPKNADVPRDQWATDLVSPTMNDKHHHNQPTVLNGFLNLNGNEEFWFWDIKDPAKPSQMSEYLTPNRDPAGGGKKEGEAESHCVSYGRYGDKFYEVTTGGKGVDIWDVTDQKHVTHVSQIALQGIDYGDFTAAVWGLTWQGNYIYVGGTDTGIHILDAHDPLHISVVKRLPTSNFGTVSAGPLEAIGNILVITTPKENGGIATMDISDPVNPIYLASIKPPKSYISQFYRHFVFMQSPLRAWDVLTDPTNIGQADKPLSSVTTPGSEYLSFGDNNLFLGRLRPNAGATVYDITDPTKAITLKSTVWGRLDRAGLNDDQFTLMIGNLLVLGDDQEPYAGSVIAEWAAAPDTTPPKVDTVIPRDKSTGVSVKSRIGISLTDNIEFVTVNAASFIVRPVGGEPLAGVWGSRMGVINFSPNESLKPATTYEVVLPKGGITDLVQNPIADDFKSTFTTK
jgi:hypothetical protein